MSSWLVLGAGGQLGLCMQEALSERGLTCTALGSSECDITDSSSVENAIKRVRPAVVVNCAAWTAVDAAEDHIDEAFAVNCTGATIVARACRDAGSVLVHVSTDYVFPGTGSGPYAEEAPTEPVSVYGKSKLCGENGVLTEHPDGSYVVRTAWLYSRHGGNFAKTMLRRALNGSAVRVVNDQLGQPTLADDLARHIVDLVQSAAPFGVYHGTNSSEGTWFDFAREIFRLAGAGQDLVAPVDTAEYPTKAVRPRNSVLGHRHTVRAGVPEMRKWQEALAHAMPGIIGSVRSETTT